MEVIGVVLAIVAAGVGLACLALLAASRRPRPVPVRSQQPYPPQLGQPKPDVWGR